MFMLTMGAGTNLGFPDVCLQYEGEAVTTLPLTDTHMTATTAPAAYNVLVDCMPVLNQMSIGVMSSGDESGYLGGVMSHLIDGQNEYLVGCFTIMVDGLPAQRMTSVTGQNCMGVMPNSPGMSISPSQVTVLSLG